MDGHTLFLIYCAAMTVFWLLQLALWFLREKYYYSTYKHFFNLLEWFFLGGAVFYVIMNWPW